MFGYGDSLNGNKFLNSLVGQLLRAIKDTGRTFIHEIKETYEGKDGEEVEKVVERIEVKKMLYDHLKTPKHTDAWAIVREVLVPALRAVGSAEALGGKCIMLVDSLDEAQWGGNITRVLVELIKYSPGWVRWVATSRPDASVKADLKPVHGGSIEFSLEGENQEADVRAYLEKALPRHPGISVICKKAKGLFKYAAMAVKMLKTDPHMNVHSLPATLNEMYMTYFYRKYGKNKKKLKEFVKYAMPMLAILIAANDALPLDLVKGDRRSLGVVWVKLIEHFEFVKNSICEKRLLNTERPLMQFGHKSIVDFLQNEDEAGVFAVDADYGHMLLASRCRNVLKLRREPTTDLTTQYSLLHLVHHLCYLHKRPYHHPDGPSQPDFLQEAARVVVDLDWLLGRLLLDKDTLGVVEEMKKVVSLLTARGSDDDAELVKAIGAVQRMTARARVAVQHDPRQIMGRIMLELCKETRAPVVDLVRQTSECKRLRWWYLCEGNLKMGGEGQDLTRIGDHAFEGEGE